MEEKQQNLKIEESQVLLKTLYIKKPEENAVASSSDDGNKNSEEVKSEESKAANSSHKVEEEKAESRSTTPARNSPEPSCAICLEQLQNKSFTDSCFHMFCFTCLVEWSKVKAECPLCKQRFKSIVHNVRSIEDYDQYYIKSKSTENIWTCFGPNERRFRYSTTVTAERHVDRNRGGYQDTIESQIASHRMRYAPHSVRLYTSSQMVSRMPCSFRRRIYEEDLWVRPSATGRIRVVSPEFYRTNTACTHRLIPWLNRELVALLQNNETQVTFVMELILALITRYEISSQEFFLHIEPYLASRTSHFIHEFFHFAISPYDMENYDRHAKYNSLDASKIRAVSSPDSDVIPLSNNGVEAEASESQSRAGSSRERKKHMRFFKRVKKLVLKRNSANDSWETVVTSVPVMHNYSSVNVHLYPIAGPSTSAATEINSGFSETPTQLSQSSQEVESVGDDECQIIDVVKPRSERTPEIVELSSGEEEPPNVIDVSSDNESLSVGASTSKEPIVSNNFNFSSDEECIFVEKSDSKETDSKEKSNSAFSSVTLASEVENKEPQPSSSISQGSAESQALEPKHSVPVSLALSSIWAIDNGTKSWSPNSKRKRNISSSSVLDGSSTESCSDPEKPSEKSAKRKKLKLRSVVAHFSIAHGNQRRDSGHRSTHKKRKEKKKKKKKHSRKHKFLFFSSDDSI